MRAQEESREAEIAQGSQTAKGGSQNEDEIREKFNKWKTNADAQAWLKAMGHRLAVVEQVVAEKPSREKADVEVTIRTRAGERVERISIKLVSNPHGFNQIDKRRLADYAEKWSMLTDVHEALKFFVGEVPPSKPGRDKRRMFLDEMDEKTQRAVIDFFATHRDEVVSDLFAGDGEHAADWMMVTLKPRAEAMSPLSTKGSSAEEKLISADTRIESAAESASHDQPKCVIRSMPDVIRFFSDGQTRRTPGGSLRIGRITMPRKGGDNGQPTANML